MPPVAHDPIPKAGPALIVVVTVVTYVWLLMVWPDHDAQVATPTTAHTECNVSERELVKLYPPGFCG